MTLARTIAALLTLFGLGQAAWAGGMFGISPLRLDLSAKAPMGAFTLLNSGKEPVVVQAQPLAWRQVDGRDLHEPTRALLVNPAIVSLGPGERQVVRVALRGAPDRRVETGFRMMFTEVPQADGQVSGRSQVRIIKRMDVPVFVAPVEGDTQPAGTLSAKAETGSIGLSFSNSGTGHWRLYDLKVSDARTGSALAPPTLLSVLPGGMRRIDLRHGDGPVPEKLLVEADVDGRPFRTELAVERR